MIANKGPGEGGRRVPLPVEMAALDSLEPELRLFLKNSAAKISAHHVAEARRDGVSVDRCLEILRRTEAKLLADGGGGV